MSQTSFEDLANIAYSDDQEHKKAKAVAAGKLLDNRLKKAYGPEGSTDCHFDQSAYEKYFSYEALGPKRNKLINDYENRTL